GPTIVSAGMLQVGNSGAVGNIADNGSFGIDRSDTYTFGGVISVTGSFVKAGTGKVVLTGNNTYQGGTAINAGTLAVITDANLGAAAGGVGLSGGRLQFLSGFSSNRGTTLSAGGGTVGHRQPRRERGVAVLPRELCAQLPHSFRRGRARRHHLQRRNDRQRP